MGPVAERLCAAGVQHEVRLIPPDGPGAWRMAVDVDDGSIDLICGRHDSDDITVVDDYDVQVSVGLAVEFVAMSLDLLDEDERADQLDREQAARHDADRQARRDRRWQWVAAWKAKLGLPH